jgi:hypothetical protein
MKALVPQPKHGKPFRIQGDRTGRFYNGNPDYPRRGPMFSYAWSIPKELDTANIQVERRDGVYVWVAPERECDCKVDWNKGLEISEMWERNIAPERECDCKVDWNKGLEISEMWERNIAPERQG